MIPVGTHNDIRAGRRLIYTTKNGALALDIECQAPDGQTITGTLYLSKTDGTPNGRALRTISEVFGIDYHDERALTEGELPPFQIVVEDEDYNGKTYRKVKWFNPNHYAPVRAEPNSDAKRQASERFRKLFNGGASMPADPFGAQPPAPAPQPTPPADPTPTQTEVRVDDLPF
jgi:hypothetical protein